MRVFITIFVVIALAGTGCSGVRGSLVETAVADTAAETAVDRWDSSQQPGPAPENGINIGDEIDSEPFAFSAPELFSGSTVSGTELYENSPMIMSFVSPSCPVCLVEGPEIAAAADANPDITYVIVHSGAGTDQYRSFADNAGLYQENVIHIEDESGVISQRFTIMSTPSTLMVDGEGRVTQSTGALEAEGHVLVANIVSGK